jgi:hypothetical protein
MVAGFPDRGPAEPIWRRPEHVALASGRPILVVPYVRNFETVGRRVLIVWNASREATRAVNAAGGSRDGFQQSGATFHPITDEVVSAASNRPAGGSNEPAKFEWPALLRKLDRIDPSYKQ